LLALADQVTDMPEQLTLRIGALLRTFSADPVRTTAALREIIALDEPRVVRAAVALLDDERAAQGARSLLGMVASRGSFVRALIDPRVLSLSEAVRIAHEISQFDTRFLSSISAAAAAPGAPPGAPDRASLIVDHRQRADRIEALWSRNQTSTAQVFEQFARDPHHRVRANALLGLHRRGDPRSIPGLVEMTESPDPLFRAAAAWAMKSSQDPRFLPVLERLSAESGRAGLNARKALETLKEIASERKKQAPWLLEPVQATLTGGGQVNVLVSVQGTGGDAPPELLPTHFIWRQGNESIWRFSRRQTEAPPRYEFAIETAPAKSPASIQLQIFHPRGWGEAEIPVQVRSAGETLPESDAEPSVA
jgi:hypothetical protein